MLHFLDIKLTLKSSSTFYSTSTSPQGFILHIFTTLKILQINILVFLDPLMTGSVLRPSPQSEASSAFLSRFLNVNSPLEKSFLFAVDVKKYIFFNSFTTRFISASCILSDPLLTRKIFYSSAPPLLTHQSLCISP